MIYPRELELVIEHLKRIPGIGEKSAERIALAILKQPEDSVINFSESVKNAKLNLHRCEVCGYLTSDTICHICADNSRDKNVICVLDDIKSVSAFEKAKTYNGVYHVLDGLISPVDDIGPEDVNIPYLIDRVKKLDKCELILALKSSVEGEATMLYITKLLKDANVQISRLPYGIPMGAEIDYLDPISLDRALNDRKIIS